MSKTSQIKLLYLRLGTVFNGLVRYRARIWRYFCQLLAFFTLVIVLQAKAYVGMMVGGHCVYAQHLTEGLPVSASSSCEWDNNDYFVMELDVIQVSDDNVRPIVKLTFYDKQLNKSLCLGHETSTTVTQAPTLFKCDESEHKVEWMYDTTNQQLILRTGVHAFNCLIFKKGKGLSVGACADAKKEESITRFVELDATNFTGKSLGMRLFNLWVKACMQSVQLPEKGGYFFSLPCLSRFDPLNTRQVVVRRQIKGSTDYTLSMPGRKLDIFPVTNEAGALLVLNEMIQQTLPQARVNYYPSTRELRFGDLCLAADYFPFVILHTIDCDGHDSQQWILFPELYDKNLHQ